MSSALSLQPDRLITGNTRVRTSGKSDRLPVFVILFVTGLLIPMSISIGPVRMSPYRLILLILAIPCIFMLLSGRVGKIRLPDFCILAHGVWAVIALNVVHGPGAKIEASGIYFVEFVVPYLLARCFIRSSIQFEKLVNLYFYILLLLLPLALFESLTGKHPVQAIFSIYFHPLDPRLGLHRALGSFEHAILFGVFSASIFALVFYSARYRSSLPGAGIKSIVPAAATFLSLSSGPLLCLLLQICLIGWDIVTRRIPKRWWVLVGLFVAMYIVIDLLSNRKPIHVFVTYMTFSVQSAYTRITIWDYGFAEVMRHPIFGIGLNDWQRPGWLSSSIDNFWLVVMMRFGIVAQFFYALAIISMIWMLCRRKLKSVRLIALRKGWVTSMVSLIFALSTVHLWNATFCHFMFIIGSCAWLLDEKDMVSGKVK